MNNKTKVKILGVPQHHQLDCIVGDVGYIDGYVRGATTTSDEIKNWHTSSIKQILEALVEREKDELSFIIKNDNGTRYEDGYEERIKDTIYHLKSIIKTL